ncbi:MAG: hypothetical protein WCO84_06890 [bacterium]
MSQSAIQMIFKFGDEVLPLGKCHPANARILVQKQLATWEGKDLKVILRPAHAEILKDNQEALIRIPEDGKNTSQAELDRRLEWFRQVMTKTTMALSEVGQTRYPDETSIHAFLEDAKALEAIAKMDSTDDTMTKEEVDEFYELNDFSFDPQVADPILQTAFEADLTTDAVTDYYRKGFRLGLPSARNPGGSNNHLPLQEVDLMETTPANEYIGAGIQPSVIAAFKDVQVPPGATKIDHTFRFPAFKRASVHEVTVPDMFSSFRPEPYPSNESSVGDAVTDLLGRPKEGIHFENREEVPELHVAVGYPTRLPPSPPRFRGLETVVVEDENTIQSKPPREVPVVSFDPDLGKLWESDPDVSSVFQQHLPELVLEDLDKRNEQVELMRKNAEELFAKKV